MGGADANKWQPRIPGREREETSSTVGTKNPLVQNSFHCSVCSKPLLLKVLLGEMCVYGCCCHRLSCPHARVGSDKPVCVNVETVLASLLLPPHRSIPAETTLVACAQLHLRQRALLGCLPVPTGQCCQGRSSPVLKTHKAAGSLCLSAHGPAPPRTPELAGPQGARLFPFAPSIHGQWAAQFCAWCPEKPSTGTHAPGQQLWV